jgi:class 3 adenylate cyclase/tetratricopeptide (TPR) repeat protein
MPLDGTCPSCLGANRLGAKFCGLCGYTLLGAPTEQSLVPARPLELGISPRLEPERKQLTVLFADIKDSMELIAFRDPEDARNILDPVVGSMMTAVHSFGGTVIRVMGDGIMALFGAPVAQEDHALRACRAALQIQELAPRLAIAKHLEQDKVDIKVRVGLNSGEVVFHYIHNAQQIDYSVTGHSVHLAARMEQLARPGTILISEFTFSACAGMLDVTPLGFVPIKGLDKPQRVFELNGVHNRGTRLEIAGHAGKLSRFVGRCAERSVLEEAAQHAMRGSGQVVALVGDPGVGKSRLAYEFTNSTQASAFFRLEARALSYATRSAFVTVVAMLRSYFSVQRGDPSSKIIESTLRKLKDLDAGLEDAPALLWLLGVRGYHEGWDALDPQIKREKALIAIRQLIISQSKATPVLFLFEDLHWIDAETQAMLDLLIDAISEVRVLLIVTHRDEYPHQWSDRVWYRRIAVHPLERSSVHEFLGDLLGSDPSLNPLKAALVVRTEGNPFYLEESVRALLETGAIVGGETYRIDKPVTELEIPPSVQSVLAARIDRLPSDDKRLLQAAAVVGHDIPFDILKEVVDMNPFELDRGLERLWLAAFLDRIKSRPLTYTFKHALTEEVAYTSLLRERRKFIHNKALRAVERVSGEDPAEYLEILARHALRAESWDKAGLYSRQAGNAAAVRSAFRDAEFWYRSAIGAWNRLPESREKFEVGFDLRIDLYAAVVTYGDITPVFEVLEEAESLAAAMADKGRISRVAGCLSMAYWWIADYPKALEQGERALTMAKAADRCGVELWIALMGLAWTESALGDFAIAKKRLTELLTMAAAPPASNHQVRNGLPSARVMTLSFLSQCYGDLGEFEEGMEAAQGAVRLAEALDQPWSRAAAYYALGSILIKRGDATQAIEVLEKGQRSCAEYLIPGWGTTISWMLGYAYALNGEPKRGVALLEQVVQDSNASRCHTRLSLRIANLAEAELLAGNQGRASDLADRALSLAKSYGERPAEGYVRKLLGDIALQANDDEATASTHYEQALAIARRHSMLALEAQCSESLGPLRHSVGGKPVESSTIR